MKYLKRRGLVEICVALLEKAKKYPGVSTSRVLSYCRLPPFKQDHPVLVFLTERGLLSVEKRTCGKGSTIVVTPKGLEWLLKAEDVLAVINQI